MGGKQETLFTHSLPHYVKSSATCRHVIGTVVNDTFIKSVRGSVHMLKVPRGWACDVSALKEAERLGAKWLVIVDDETETRYRATLATFLRDGIPVNRGFGAQLALPLELWQTTRRGDVEATQLGFGL